MDDPLPVGRFERLHDLDRDPQRLLDGDGPLPDLRPQCLAVDVLHDDEVAALGLGDLVDMADVGVVERRRRPGLADETLVRLFVPLHFGRKELQCDAAVERCVLGQEYLAHAAPADLLEDAVTAKVLPDHVLFPV